MKRNLLWMAACGLLLPLSVRAELPVLDSVPRWDDAFGLEISYETYGSDKLMQGSHKLANPLGLEKRVHETQIQGVYYDTKELGVFFKLPYYDMYKDKVRGGAKVREADSGFGDLELGPIFKHYWNMPQATAEVTFAPMLRVPTGSHDGPEPVADGSTDAGFEVSGKYETFRHMWMAGAEYWHNSEGAYGIDQGDEVSAHAMYGYHIYAWPEYQAGFFLIPYIEAMYEAEGHDRDGPTGGVLIHGGPAIKLYKANYLLYVETALPIYERVEGTNLSEGAHIHISIGTAF